MAWHAKEVIRSVYDIEDPQVAVCSSLSRPSTCRTGTAHGKSAGSAGRWTVQRATRWHPA